MSCFVFTVLQHFIPKLLTSPIASQNVDKANGSQHKFRETISWELTHLTSKSELAKI